jgi:hypothetical protein
MRAISNLCELCNDKKAASAAGAVHGLQHLEKL